MLQNSLQTYAEDVLEKCREQGLKLVTAESCTAGLLGGVLTEIPGASDVYERGFITYSNQAKIEMLGVSKEMIETHGAVSELVACAMAEGALKHSRADLAVAITGIAGPGGGSDDKPVGTVHIACAKRGSATIHDKEVFGSSRREIRIEAVQHALRMLSSRV